MKSRQRIAIEQLQKAQNAHDLEALLACFAPNFQGNHPRHPERGVEGVEGARKNWSGIFHDSPNFHSELLRSAVEGDTAWAEWSGRIRFSKKKIRIVQKNEFNIKDRGKLNSIIAGDKSFSGIPR